MHVCAWACRGQRGPETSYSQWVPLDSTHSSTGVSQEQHSPNVFILALHLPRSFTKEQADCLCILQGHNWKGLGGQPVHPPLLRDGAQRGGKAESHGTLGLSQDQNHTGLETLHPEAASEEEATAPNREILPGGWGERPCATWLSPAQGARPWAKGKSQAKFCSSQPPSPPYCGGH